MTLSPRRNLYLKSAKPIPNIEAEGRLIHSHLADKPILIYRPALLSVCHGRLCPHLFLLESSVLAYNILSPFGQQVYSRHSRES